MPGEEELNFERVTKVYREETGRKTLTALEVDFYDKLAAYVQRLEVSAQEETQKDPNSPKALIVQDELRKVRKKRDQIFTYRERKLALLASSRSSGGDVELPTMPTQERALFDELVILLKRTREAAFAGSPHGSKPGPSPPMPGHPGTRPSTEHVVKAEEAKRPRAPPSLKDHVVVHVLEDIPPFAGIDTTYRLKKEDVITLPKTIAQILMERGKARIVEMRETIS